MDLDDEMLYYVWGSHEESWYCEYNDDNDTAKLIECPDCKGHGNYLLFNLRHKCDLCEGTGKASVRKKK
jgi:DnaJ-class molecular chaperone